MILCTSISLASWPYSIVGFYKLRYAAYLLHLSPAIVRHHPPCCSALYCLNWVSKCSKVRVPDTAGILKLLAYHSLVRFWPKLLVPGWNISTLLLGKNVFYIASTLPVIKSLVYFVDFLLLLTLIYKVIRILFHWVLGNAHCIIMCKDFSYDATRLERIHPPPSNTHTWMKDGQPIKIVNLRVHINLCTLQSLAMQNTVNIRSKESLVENRKSWVLLVNIASILNYSCKV